MSQFHIKTDEARNQGWDLMAYEIMLGRLRGAINHHRALLDRDIKVRANINENLKTIVARIDARRDEIKSLRDSLSTCCGIYESTEKRIVGDIHNASGDTARTAGLVTDIVDYLIDLAGEIVPGMGVASSAWELTKEDTAANWAKLIEELMAGSGAGLLVWEVATGVGCSWVKSIFPFIINALENFGGSQSISRSHSEFFVETGLDLLIVLGGVLCPPLGVISACISVLGKVSGQGDLSEMVSDIMLDNAAALGDWLKELVGNVTGASDVQTPGWATGGVG